jgi:hypothetical protein
VDVQDTDEVAMSGMGKVEKAWNSIQFTVETSAGRIAVEILAGDRRI